MRLIEWLLGKLFPTLDTPYGYSRRRLIGLRSETETRRVYGCIDQNPVGIVAHCVLADC